MGGSILKISKLQNIERWLCKKYKQVQDTKENNKLRWLATDIN